MSTLVRLYPQAWRDRYGDEFLDLLDTRPPGLRDRLDILLGAVDARLNPEMPGTSPERASASRALRGRRLAGLVAIVGGALWASVAIIQLNAPLVPGETYKDGTMALLIGLFASLATGLAAILAADVLDGLGPRGRTIGIAIVVASFLFVLPWPILVLGVYGSWLSSSAYGFLLGTHGHRIGLALVVGGLLAIPANLENATILLIVPLGLAWIGFGLTLAVGRRAVVRTSGPSTGAPP